MTRIAQILSTGSYVPERVVTNDEMDRLIGEPTGDWLVANVGIRERRWMSPEQTTSDLIVEAARKALDKAGVAPEQLNLIIVSTGHARLPVAGHVGRRPAQIGRDERRGLRRQ